MAYFPNSSAGDYLDQQCQDCPLGFGWNDPNQQELFHTERQPKPCPVFFTQVEFNYEQVKNKKLQDALTILVNNDGVCQVRKLLVEARGEQP